MTRHIDAELSNKIWKKLRSTYMNKIKVSELILMPRIYCELDCECCTSLIESYKNWICSIRISNMKKLWIWLVHLHQVHTYLVSYQLDSLYPSQHHRDSTPQIDQPAVGINNPYLCQGRRKVWKFGGAGGQIVVCNQRLFITNKIEEEGDK